MKQLTPQMKRAIRLAQSNKGVLRRLSGRYWATNKRSQDMVGTSTIDALLDRDLVSITGRKPQQGYSEMKKVTLTLKGMQI